MGGALPEFLRMAREGHEEKERCSFGLKYPISPMPDDETLHCGDLREEISRTIPGKEHRAILTEDGAGWLSSRPSGRNQEKAHRVFPPHSPIFPSGRDSLGGRRRKSVLCLPNLFIEQGYFLLFKRWYIIQSRWLFVSLILCTALTLPSLAATPVAVPGHFSRSDRSRF